LYKSLPVSIPSFLLNLEYSGFLSCCSLLFLASAAGDISSVSKASKAVSVSAATCTFTSPSFVLSSTSLAVFSCSTCLYSLLNTLPALLANWLFIQPNKLSFVSGLKFLIWLVSSEYTLSTKSTGTLSALYFEAIKSSK